MNMQLYWCVSGSGDTNKPNTEDIDDDNDDGVPGT